MLSLAPSWRSSWSSTAAGTDQQDQLAVEVADFADESFEFCEHAHPLSPSRLRAVVDQGERSPAPARRLRTP